MSMYHFSDTEAVEHDVNTVPDFGDFERVEIDGQWYVPERTCRMLYCYTHDTCVVNKELGNGNFASMEFGYKKCSECGAYVFDCPTVRYCPGCGAKVTS